MTEFFSKSLPAKVLGARLGPLRSRGRTALLAALGAPETTSTFPKLQGEALAKHYLALALEACQDVGTSKPQAFGKLRLLVNKLEQGRIPSRPPEIVVPPSAQGPTSRRSRLLSRALQSAQQLAQGRSLSN